MTSPGYRLVVFDWDGTLIDSIATIVACTQATLLELNLQRASAASIRSVIGLGIREMVECFSPGCSESTFDQIVAVYRKLWFERFSSESSLFEGVPDLLQGLLEDGHLLAIATAKSRKGLERDLQRTGLKHCFHATRTADDTASKPSPAMLLELLDELGVRDTETLMIGDALHDLQMADNAGVTALGVATGATSREALQGRGPLDCLDSVLGLRGWLADRDLAERDSPAP